MRPRADPPQSDKVRAHIRGGRGIQWSVRHGGGYHGYYSHICRIRLYRARRADPFAVHCGVQAERLGAEPPARRLPARHTHGRGGARRRSALQRQAVLFCRRTHGGRRRDQRGAGRGVLAPRRMHGRCPRLPRGGAAHRRKDGDAAGRPRAHPLGDRHRRDRAARPFADALSFGRGGRRLRLPRRAAVPPVFLRGAGGV